MPSEPPLTIGQPVRLREALPQLGLPPGALGAVVLVHTRPRLAYEVEFVREDGGTRGLATLLPSQISPVPPVG
jgi:hypothetical protein